MAFVAPEVASSLAFMPSDLIGIILDYHRRIEPGRSHRGGKLEILGNEPIQATQMAFAMRMNDGSVTSWGNRLYGGDSSLVQARLKNVKALCATQSAFAAIVGDDNQVICWGNKDYGGDGPSDLKQVVGICASGGAFAALKRDGTVTTWGHSNFGGDSCRLKGVKAIYSTQRAFVAVLHDGTVEAWGDQEFSPILKKQLHRAQVQSVSGSDCVFAALLNDGTVETWGRLGALERSLFQKAQLSEVALICAAAEAFAALKKDGTVVCWGNSEDWVAPFRVREVLKRVVAISSTCRAFAMLRSDGSVVSWGRLHERDLHPTLGIINPNGSSVPSDFNVVGKLKEVVSICGTMFAFAALQRDGTVVTWGDKDYGGDSSAVQNELTGVVSIGAAASTFAAQKSDGTVVTWGSDLKAFPKSKINLDFW